VSRKRKKVEGRTQWSRTRYPWKINSNLPQAPGEDLVESIQNFGGRLSMCENRDMSCDGQK
jgi:hypothetical protein